jgi:carbon storage regulator
MLVLSRKIGEEIIIGGNVAVRVVSLNGNRVRLGFTGPPETRIYREEIARRLAAEPSTNGRARLPVGARSR